MLLYSAASGAIVVVTCSDMSYNFCSYVSLQPCNAALPLAIAMKLTGALWRRDLWHRVANFRLSTNFRSSKDVRWTFILYVYLAYHYHINIPFLATLDYILFVYKLFSLLPT